MIYKAKKMIPGTLLILALLLSVSAMAYAEQASEVRATRVDGQATLDGGPLRDGTIITRDGRIETQAGAAVVLTWSNGSMLELYPQSAIVLKGVIFDAERKIEKTLLTLEKGRIFVKAQVPEHIFSHFETEVGGTPIMSQGAEFALKFSPAEKEFSVLSLLGRVVITVNDTVQRVDDGQMFAHREGGAVKAPAAMPEKTKGALTKTSKRLGGSLLVEEELAPPGGPLKVKIGGVRNRRGNAPYTVKFKARTGGGSGTLKNIHWEFGDGVGADGREAEHVFTQGVYAVVLTVEDENGQTASAQMNISVEIDCGC